MPLPHPNNILAFSAKGPSHFVLGMVRFSGGTMFIYLSLLVALLGLLAYVLSANPKLQEIGRISYFAGLLAFLFHFVGPTVNVLR